MLSFLADMNWVVIQGQSDFPFLKIALSKASPFFPEGKYEKSFPSF
jgi:hypothetical protein